MGVSYDYDVVIDRGKVRRRKKNPSKQFRDAFGRTPLPLEEDIPWKCRRLVVGTGTGALPVMKEVEAEAKRREIELLTRFEPEISSKLISKGSLGCRQTSRIETPGRSLNTAIAVRER